MQWAANHMIRRLLAPLWAALRLAGCATTPAQRPGDAFAGGMVSAADPRAAEAGAAMLRQGGSATDAALAILLALTVVEPQSSGIGGGGLLLTDDGKGGVESFDGRETAPAAATPQWFETNGQYLAMGQVVPGGLSTGVPGNFAMMALAHRRHGKLPWKALFAPAVALARDGFEVTPRLRSFLERMKGTAAFTPEGTALWYGPDGVPVPVGTRVRNPALAAFLERLASEGPSAFYRGANARAVAQAVRNAPRRPALMTEGDLAAYRAKQRAPVCGGYRGWRICGMGPPSSGATTVLGVLGMLERFDMGALGKDDPKSWHLMAEAMRLAYADRDRYLADADFVSVPVAGLIAPEYLARRAALIAPDRTMAQAPAGSPPGAVATRIDAPSGEVPSTSHFAVIDRKGRAATLTSTIEGPFGSGLVVNGYYLNNELTDFAMVPERDGRLVANRVAAGKRPLSSMSPTLAYGPDGRLRLAIGAAGGKTIPAQVAKALVGVIDWKLTAQEAIALPLVYAPGGDTVIVEPGTMLEAMIPALTALGHAKVEARAMPLKANAVEVAGAVLRGGADPRSEGAAVSE